MENPNKVLGIILIIILGFFGLVFALKPSGEEKLGRVDIQINEIIDQLGIDSEDFNECVQDDAIAQLVDDQYQSGVEAGVTGTPGVFIVNKELNKGAQLPGAVDYEALVQFIDAMLSGEFDDQLVDLPNFKLPDESDHISGNKEANIFLVEYSDFDCSYCKLFHETTKMLIDSHGDRVGVVFRMFPLRQAGPMAQKKAISAECASKLGGISMFEQFIDKLFALQ